MTDFLHTVFDKIRCRLFRIHGWSCRGRDDHTDFVNGSTVDPGRWRP